MTLVYNSLTFTAVSNDAAYNGATRTAMVDVADGPGLVVSTSEIRLTEAEDGDVTARFMVSLAAVPVDADEDVTVAVSSDNEDVTVSPESLTFNMANFDEMQTVTVTVAADEDATDDSAMISLLVSSRT